MIKRLSINPVPLSSWASRRIYAICPHQQTPGCFEGAQLEPRRQVV